MGMRRRGGDEGVQADARHSVAKATWSTRWLAVRVAGSTSEQGRNVEEAESTQLGREQRGGRPSS